MASNIKNILKKLELDLAGKYDNHFYVISLEDSNEYARMYTLLSKNATNTEFPNIESNTNNNATKITNYFEITDSDTTYNIFLIADFSNEKYYIKIGEQ